MTRVATTNYSATLSTQFQWATADSDVFDRELDLYRMAQALELHDHTATRGLSVGRIANNIVAEASLQDNAVTVNKLAANAVTAIKIVDGVITRAKLSFPWTQNGSNDMNGGFRMRETTVTYEMGFYQATNGLAVFGTGPISGGVPPTQFILGQGATASFGLSHGAAKVNIMQTASNFDSGLRVYNANPAFFTDFVNDGNGNLVVGYNGAGSFWVSQGRACIGNTINNFIARMNIEQTSQGATEGFLTRHTGTGTGRMYVGAAGAFFVGSETTKAQFETASATLSPDTHQAVALGRSGLTWGALWCTTINASAASTLTSLSCTTLACTTIAASGLITANAGITTAAGQAVIPATNNTGTVGSAANAYQQVHAGELISYTKIYPVNNGVQPLGDVSNQWARVWSSNVWIGMGGAGSKQLEIGSDSAGKPSTNTWQVTSDGRTKTKSSIKPYTDGLNKILGLDPVWYRYNGLGGTPKPKDQTDDSIGFLAEDAREIAPELVRTHRGKLRQSDPEETDILSVDTHALPFMMINALKEIVGRLEALENRTS